MTHVDQSIAISIQRRKTDETTIICIINSDSKMSNVTARPRFGSNLLLILFISWKLLSVESFSLSSIKTTSLKHDCHQKKKSQYSQKYLNERSESGYSNSNDYKIRYHSFILQSSSADDNNDIFNQRKDIQNPDSFQIMNLDDDKVQEQSMSGINYLESILRRMKDQLITRNGTPPPAQVEDFNVLFYDIFLIVNLAVSISFWVIHRMDFQYVGAAFNEGCLMSLLWIGSGLYTGAFLNSSVDGHYGAMNTSDGGPKGAGLLAAHTFVNAINLRLLFALIIAVVQHRPVGEAIGEQIMPLEIGFGFILMVFWRALHSSYTPRM